MISNVDANNLYEKIQVDENFCLNNNYLNNETSLFDSSVFNKIDTNMLQFKYDTLKLKKAGQNEFVFDLGESLILRPLRKGDFERGYLQLLEQVRFPWVVFFYLVYVYTYNYYLIEAYDCWR
jgi:hypothetical protein